jgi:3-hydroxybutyryl-CoA dehydrogenase
MTLSAESTIGILGAGAMGSGIAIVAARAGHNVVLADASEDALAKARASIDKVVSRDVEKGRLPAEEGDQIRALISTTGELRNADLIIEAIVEKLESESGDDCILATNTSSLSIAAIAAACRKPERVVGIHFFNPANVMPLVEIVPGIATEPVVARAARERVDAWGKKTAMASDTPGFIVNRVARPFYGEALRIYEEGIADIATIDWAMREIGGFRMGPFELMDFIGHDVNYVVTSSVWEAMYYDPRYKPSIAQKRLLDAGRLGRKTEIGFYDYREGAERPRPSGDTTAGQAIVDRIVAMLINEAADAVFMRVASPAEVDMAMRLGVNYPKGLLEWGDQIGPRVVLDRIERLQAEYGEDRYRPSPLLRRVVNEGRSLSA